MYLEILEKRIDIMTKQIKENEKWIKEKHELQRRIDKIDSIIANNISCYKKDRIKKKQIQERL